MGLFQKSAKRAPTKDNLPQYVDSLLDAADLDSIHETEPVITGATPDYGIDEVIELLQKLPQENTALVVAVVRETLQSANIDVARVVEDAQAKTTAMEERMAALQTEIAVLKTQIAQKETQIVQTNTALKETRRVQNLLQSESGAISSSVVKLNTVSR